ncbi:MAG: cytochrome c3 family protein, partial [Pseudomonadota bacterium]
MSGGFMFQGQRSYVAFARQLAWAFALLAALCATLWMTPGWGAEAKPRANFSHLKTGFALSGAHARAKCESCHVQGVFKGTPTQCQNCHIAGNKMGGTAKPSTHIPTAESCDTCHHTSAWSPAIFSHSGIAPGTCATCHNGKSAAGKSASHIRTTASCDTCHITVAWTPAKFNHKSADPAACATCHNGVIATGKSSKHIATIASCAACHRTSAWVPVTAFNHLDISTGCIGCHNDIRTRGKPKDALHSPANIKNGDNCEICHRTTSTYKAGVSFNHSVAIATCVTCHNGKTAKGKSTTHIATTAACETCHAST